jgi:hypothetical protein
MAASCSLRMIVLRCVIRRDHLCSPCLHLFFARTRPTKPGGIEHVADTPPLYPPTHLSIGTIVQVVKELLHASDALTAATFSPCGKWLAAGSHGGVVYIFDMDDNLVLEEEVRCVCLTNAGRIGRLRAFVLQVCALLQTSPPLRLQGERDIFAHVQRLRLPWRCQRSMYCPLGDRLPRQDLHPCV